MRFYIIDNRYSIIAISIISFINFLYPSVNFIYNNDSVGRLVKYPSLDIEIGIMTGRWFYPIVYNALITFVKAPIITLLTTIVFLVFSVILLWKIFTITKPLYQIITGGIFVTSPIFTHFYFYEGDTEVYYFALVLIIFSLYLLINRNGLVYKILAIILNILALACYPALISFITSLYFMYIIYTHWQSIYIGQKYLKIFFSYVMICIISILTYYLSSKFFLYVYDLHLTSYRGVDKLSISDVILNIPNRIIIVYSLFIERLQNANQFTQIILIVSFIAYLFDVLIVEKHRIKQLLIALLNIGLMPLFILSIYLIVQEEFLYPGFEYGFILLNSIILIISLKKIPIYKNLLTLISLSLIFTQIQESNRIALEHQLNVESSKLLLSNIINDIQKFPKFKRSSVIVFTGNVNENMNFNFVDVIPHTSMMNYANVPVGFVDKGDYFTSNMQGQLRLMGFMYNVSYNDSYGKDMPDYPKQGSIKSLNDSIIINLGNSKF